MNPDLTCEPQLCGIPVSGKRHQTILGDIGTALLAIKNNRGLTLVQMGEEIRKSDDTMARYIAGEKEMGVVTWLRAREAWPELPNLVAESAAERSLKAKQRHLDIDLPRQQEPKETDAEKLQRIARELAEIHYREKAA